MEVNVGELRAALEGWPDDVIVILQKDAEGNGYSPLEEASAPGECIYVAETTWSGEAYNVADLDESWDTDGHEPCLVLAPVN